MRSDSNRKPLVLEDAGQWVCLFFLWLILVEALTSKPLDKIPLIPSKYFLTYHIYLKWQVGVNTYKMYTFHLLTNRPQKQSGRVTYTFRFPTVQCLRYNIIFNFLKCNILITKLRDDIQRTYFWYMLIKVYIYEYCYQCITLMEHIQNTNRSI